MTNILKRIERKINKAQQKGFEPSTVILSENLFENLKSAEGFAEDDSRVGRILGVKVIATKLNKCCKVF